MKSTREILLEEIEAFLDHHQMAPTQFGALAVRDAKFVGRLREGHDVRTKTVDRVRDFMARHPNRPSKPARFQPAA